MVIRHVSAWAHWLVVVGLLLPVIGFFGIRDYDPMQGFWRNAAERDVVVFFSYGQNPIECLSHGLRTRLATPLAMKVENNYSCNLNTRIPYRNLLFVSFLFFVAGLFGFFNKEEYANMWPTEWHVHSKSSIRKPDQEVKVELDSEIEGKDGGF